MYYDVKGMQISVKSKVLLMYDLADRKDMLGDRNYFI